MTRQKLTITLGDMRAKGMTMLVVACDLCGRSGRLRIARLIEEYGAETQGDFRRWIACDCPRMQDPHAPIYERCRVHFPELARWFVPRRAPMAPADRAALTELIERTMTNRSRSNVRKLATEIVRAIEGEDWRIWRPEGVDGSRAAR
jgi:hypothetical protein